MRKGTMIVDCAKCPHQRSGCPGFNDYIIYRNTWKQRRWEVAKDVMREILSNENLTTRIEESSEYMSEGVAREAVLLASTLIKEFQKS